MRDCRYFTVRYVPVQYVDSAAIGTTSTTVVKQPAKLLQMACLFVFQNLFDANPFGLMFVNERARFYRALGCESKNSNAHNLLLSVTPQTSTILFFIHPSVPSSFALKQQLENLSTSVVILLILLLVVILIQSFEQAIHQAGSYTRQTSI